MSITNQSKREYIYSLYDVKARTYGSAITHEDEVGVQLFFSQLVNTKGSGSCNTHPEDFVLYSIGSILDGRVESEHRIVVSLSALVKNLHCKSEGVK
ncbi:MAG: nonstructural protein [Microviridae sp.]|nr:MAG: nonstructural protein [Microviridae sp.]